MENTKPEPEKKSPAKPTTPKKKSVKESPAKGLTLEQAQKAAQKAAPSRPGVDQIIGFLSRKSNLGKLFSSEQIAKALSNGATGQSVRRTMQRAGLARGKPSPIEHDKLWVYLQKEGNGNRYRATAKGRS